MKFMMTFEFDPEAFEDATERFLATGGQPPEGVTLVGRWHAAAGRCGYLLVEADDAARIFHFASLWQDLMDIDVVPVIDDEEAAEVLRGLDDDDA